MSKETTMVRKPEDRTPKGIERTSTVPVFVPRCDIYERDDGLMLHADMPGVDEKSVDVELEAGVLTISGKVPAEDRPDHEIIYREFHPGDFRRSFTLTDEIDSGKIEASVKNGVLRVYLPKAEAAKPRKIAVKSE